MALINCAECGKEISDKAEACPHCGNPIVVKPTQSFEDFDKEFAPPKKMKVSSTAVLLIIFFGLLALICSTPSSSPTSSYSSTPAYTPPDPYMAWAMTKDFVTKRLKSPSTAKYPRYPTDDIKQSGKIFTINSYVDSQNGFGATIRTEFEVVLEGQGNGKWALLSIDFK